MAASLDRRDELPPRSWIQAVIKSPFLMINLLSGVYWFDEALQAALKASGTMGVTRAQSLLIANIAAGEHRAIRLARNLGVSRQAMSQMIAELESRGILRVAEHPQDRRARVVDFSSSSEPLRTAASQVLLELEGVLKDRIGARRFEIMRAALMADWGEPPYASVVSVRPRPRRTRASNA